jgi:LCP family protein required for cell wall assembly
MYNEEERHLGRQLGVKLEMSRRGQDLTLEEMQQRTQIWAHQLEALERGDFDTLPSPMWARGLLMKYANSLGLDGKSLVEAYFPQSHPFQTIRRSDHRLRRRVAAPLKRYWKEALAAALGAIAATAFLVGMAIVFPYNGLTGGLNDFFHRIAPGLFLSSDPQRVAVFSDTQVGAAGEGNVMTVKVAQDGLGMLSIPRNTLVQIPGRGRGALSDALALGGPDLTRRTAARLTGLEVPYYLAVSAKGVREIVDEMGGVQIDVPNPVSGKAAFSGPKLTLRPGPQTLNGDQALVYLQGTDLPNDAKRAERQRAFLSSMFSQALSPRNLLSNPATLNAVLENAQTNINAVEAIQLTGRLRALKDSGNPIESRIVPGQEARSASIARGDASGDYWVPDVRKLPDVLDETLR